MQFLEGMQNTALGCFGKSRKLGQKPKVPLYTHTHFNRRNAAFCTKNRVFYIIILIILLLTNVIYNIYYAVWSRRLSTTHCDRGFSC